MLKIIPLTKILNINSLMKKLKIVITIAKQKMGLATLSTLIPQALKIVSSDFKLKSFTVITVAKRVEIGIVKTKTWGKFKTIIIIAMWKGMPYKDICFIN